jgi:hypothetical protein
MISNERRGHFLLSSVILRYPPYISVQNVEEAKKKSRKEKREGNLATQEGAYKRGGRKKGRETFHPRRGHYL